MAHDRAQRAQGLLVLCSYRLLACGMCANSLAIPKAVHFSETAFAHGRPTQRRPWTNAVLHQRVQDVCLLDHFWRQGGPVQLQVSDLALVSQADEDVRRPDRQLVDCAPRAGELPEELRLADADFLLGDALADSAEFRRD